mmetsp:Transcript_1908/g.5351  ORF Transcript_1908/g.5351 Transcript_1908/m.5351 type:complete len:290 (-) Transcript_1908:1533-2402(-)
MPTSTRSTSRLSSNEQAGGNLNPARLRDAHNFTPMTKSPRSPTTAPGSSTHFCGGPGFDPWYAASTGSKTWAKTLYDSASPATSPRGRSSLKVPPRMSTPGFIACARVSPWMVVLRFKSWYSAGFARNTRDMRLLCPDSSGHSSGHGVGKPNVGVPPNPGRGTGNLLRKAHSIATSWRHPRETMFTSPTSEVPSLSMFDTSQTQPSTLTDLAMSCKDLQTSLKSSRELSTGNMMDMLIRRPDPMFDTQEVKKPSRSWCMKSRPCCLKPDSTTVCTWQNRVKTSTADAPF